MKKFLSLVLALIMTMSLVTIGASAAEYKDFTDKDEIQYEEAVAVLNRLGIITGYSEGDFRPEGELTRGAAAKIIASLLIGPEAAENLSPTSAPFKDVPLDHTFAGPIAYCSTLKIINGYSDGSFQPGGTLTGYAFSKMLLGALGYDGSIEGFTGAGWNMKVSALGAEAGLFDRISFKGNEPVNREQAAQLALNTLKGTLVEYSGGLNVTAGDASVTSNPTRNYKTSNQEYAQHISNRKAGWQQAADNTWYTVEFGEEHFVDLRMTHDRNTLDDFGRPSNEWSYKKVTIGTFPIAADKIYTEQVAHDVTTVTNASKARALELTGFEVVSNREHGATTVTVNGKVESTKLADVGEIADYTDNGTLVEVYISEDNADWVQNVVVIKTQLMEVKRLGKDSVSLDLYDGGSANKGNNPVTGFNQAPIDKKVNNVEVDDAYYTLLSGLKVGDRVAVVPVTTDGGSSYTVAKAYVPETASGKLNKVSTYGTSANVNTVGVTVADTAYDVALWNKDLTDIDANKLDVTTKDVTLTLDEYGNAMLAEDVGATSDFMIVGSYYQSLVNGKLVTYVNGWDISGEELTLNLGSKNDVGYVSDSQPGDLAYYTNSNASGDADWTLSEKPRNGVFNVFTGTDNSLSTPTGYSIKASNTRIRTLQQVWNDANHSNYVSGATDDFNPWIDKNIKFIYVNFDEDSGDVDSIEIKNGVQATTNGELGTTYKNPGRRDYDSAQLAIDVKDGAIKADGTVKAVVIKNESNDAVATNMLYVVNYEGSVQRRSDDGELVYEYTVAMNGSSGIIDDEMTIYSTKKLNRGDWARYTEVKDDNFENFYNLTRVNQQKRATSTMEANFIDPLPTSNKALVRVDGATMKEPNGNALADGDVNISAPKDTNLGVGDANTAHLLNLRYARWVDLSGNGIDSYDDLYDLTHDDTKEFDLRNVRASMIYNDDTSKDNFRQVSMIVILSTGAPSSGGSGVEENISYSTRLMSNGIPIVDFTVTKPSWAASDAVGTVTGDLYVDGVKSNWTGAITINGSGTVSGRGTDTADDANDVDVQKISVTWDKVKVVEDKSNPLPDVVKVSSSVVAGRNSSITVMLRDPSARTVTDAASVKSGTVTVKEGNTTLTSVALDAAAAKADGQVISGLNVSGTAAVTVVVTVSDIAPSYAVTVNNNALANYTAAVTGSPVAAGGKFTVTLTGPKATTDNGKKSVTITYGTNSTLTVTATEVEGKADVAAVPAEYEKIADKTAFDAAKTASKTIYSDNNGTVATNLTWDESIGATNNFYLLKDGTGIEAVTGVEHKLTAEFTAPADLSAAITISKIEIAAPSVSA